MPPSGYPRPQKVGFIYEWMADPERRSEKEFATRVLKISHRILRRSLEEADKLKPGLQKDVDDYKKKRPELRDVFKKNRDAGYVHQWLDDERHRAATSFAKDELTISGTTFLARLGAANDLESGLQEKVNDHYRLLETERKTQRLGVKRGGSTFPDPGAPQHRAPAFAGIARFDHAMS